jgi:hypothetical protein
MRKLFITLIVALLIIPSLGFAQERTAEVLRDASPSLSTPQAKSLQPQAITYHWRVVFNVPFGDG